MPDISKCPLHEINAFDPELLKDPHAYYTRLRNEAPVYRDPATNIVFISTDALIREANRNVAVFSNDFNSVLQGGGADGISDEEKEIRAQGIPPIDTMLTADPPVHTRYRKLGMKAFTYKRVMKMGDYIEKLSNELIDDFIDDQQCEFREKFANLLPMYVIVDMLGAPREDFDKFKRWSEAFVTALDGVSDQATRVESARQQNEFQKYFIGKIEEKRANPTDDVISDLVHADLADEGDSRKMDNAELLSFCAQILVAGNESTANQLTDALYQLLAHPEQMALIRNDDSLIENFVEEGLRMLSPSSNMWRAVKQDFMFHGEQLKAGDMVLLRYGSANRDEARYECPQEFHVDRENAKEHLAFGYGIHTCIGGQLARKEMAVAFRVLLKRMSDIRLSPKQETIEYSPNILLRGPIELHIEFDKAS